MNGTAITNRLQHSFKITRTDHRIIEILGEDSAGCQATFDKNYIENRIFFNENIL
jgi:hypothetical protein